MNFTSPIHIIEQEFGVGLSPKLISTVDKTELSKFKYLYEAIKKFEKSRQEFLPPKKPYELRPYFPGIKRHSISLLSNQIGIHEKSFESQSSVWQLSNEISSRLLYCHSVVLDDPIWMLVDAIIVYTENNDSTYREKSIDRFKNYLSFLYHFKELIDQEIVLFVGLNDCMYRVFSKNDERFDAESLSQKIGEAKIAKNLGRENLETFEGEVLVNLAKNLMSDISVIDKKLGKVDYLIPYPFWIDVLKVLLTSNENEKLRNHLSDRNCLMHSSLCSIRVPSIGLLKPKEIVQIRKNEEVFEDWRIGLRRGLMMYHEEGEKRNLNEEDIREIFEESLIDKRNFINAKINKSKFLNSAKAASKTLLVGSAASLLISPIVGGVQNAMLTALSTSLLELIYELNSKSQIDKALMQHYVCFKNNKF